MTDFSNSFTENYSIPLDNEIIDRLREDNYHPSRIEAFDNVVKGGEGEIILIYLDAVHPLEKRRL